MTCFAVQGEDLRPLRASDTVGGQKQTVGCAKGRPTNHTPNQSHTSIVVCPTRSFSKNSAHVLRQPQDLEIQQSWLVFNVLIAIILIMKLFL